ncbi:chromatin target of PRMT1 protein isoform X1 [Esox lucius]|uniref:Chromatin target of PRMT1 protein C-terminal domain-containing protein n=1 Tax=Esox lucius TaxID=8010 RepID=A0A3P8ZHN7_ESOLU|nr:chromatin target of PRMT1 protein isoform X1 [Esox lucius]XP_010882968.1 chromatin target of PRMT1 protein isoform X1 [Esox lucius]
MYRQTDAMTSPTSVKIVLIGTSTASLNERFTTILKNKQQEPVDVQVNLQQEASSVANRRLARQMENRASVRAALQLKSLQLHQGKGDVLDRLGRPMGSLIRGVTRSRGFAVWGVRRMNRGGFGALGNVQRGFFRGVKQTKLKFLQGMQGSQLNRSGALVSRGSKCRLRGRGRGEHLSQRGRGWFRGQGMGRPEKIPSKEELDHQLDDYMSMSKARLDADLDSYMAMAGSDYIE